MESARIVALCVGLAIAYGIAHDQVTARVCVEYFTIGHPRIVATESPTLLALLWGVVATWWVGLGLGVILACAARLGAAPKVGARQLVGPILRLLLVMAMASLAAGVVGWILAQAGVVHLVGRLSTRVPPERHTQFLADLWAHNAAYLFGAFGGLILAVRTFRRRRSAPSTT